MAAPRKHLLFVDDDEQFLALLRQVLGELAGERWTILTAADAGRALGRLQEHPVDLLVLDLRMPVIDGLQFLGLLRRTWPNLRRVVLTGDPGEASRAACLNAGAELCLAKPTAPEGWRQLYTTLDGLVRFPPAEGFRGVLRAVSLQEILQMECLSRNSSILEITTGEFVGHIYIQQGQIVHAEAGHRAGTEAFYYLLGLRAGEFNLHPFTEPPRRTLTEPWEFLLMEAARRRDEGHAPLPAEAPPPAEALPAAEPSGEESVPAASAPPSTQAPVPAPPPLAAEDAAAARPQIEEMLIASAQGSVLYEWQCPQAGERIRLLEFVCERARELAESLPLGQFDRLETRAGPWRAVAQVQAERTVFLRCCLQPLASPTAASRP